MSENIEMNVKSTKLSINTMKRRFNGLTNNKRLLIKTIFITLCFLPFVYQSVKLIHQYLDRETVVKISLENNEFNPIPAITLCFPHFISIERSLQKYPELKPKFEDYMKTFKNMTEFNYENLKNSENFTKLYSEDFDNFINEQNLTANQLSYLGISNLKEAPDVDILITGARLFPNGTIEEWVNWGFNHTYNSPIEYSTFRGRNNQDIIDYKCYTYFSHLDKDNRLLKVNILGMDIDVSSKNEILPPDFKTYLCMHSPRDVPAKLFAKVWWYLKIGYNYVLDYNQMKTILQKAPYHTNCREYDLNEQDHIRTQSDCINHCMDEEIKQRCKPVLKEVGSKKRTDCLLRSDRLWRQQLFTDKNNNIKLCKINQKNNTHPSIDSRCYNAESHYWNDVEAKCSKICQNDCQTWYYDSRITSKNAVNSSRTTHLYIENNGMPDQTIEHLPKMTFEEITGALGGLSGIWFGLSVLALSNYMLELI